MRAAPDIGENVRAALAQNSAFAARNTRFGVKLELLPDGYRLGVVAPQAI